MAKLVVIGVFFFFCGGSDGQILTPDRIDSVTNLIDGDSGLYQKHIRLDTLADWFGTMAKIEERFDAYSDKRTDRIEKITWNTEGEYYSFVTIYYQKGFAIKCIIKAKYRRTDTNPEFETHAVYYLQQDKVIAKRELNGNTYPSGCSWHLYKLNYLIKLAGLTSN